MITRSTELEQAWIRLLLSSILIFYLLGQVYWGGAKIELSSVLSLAGIFLIGALALLFGIYKGKSSESRKICGIFLDMAGITAGMLISGEHGAMAFGAYLFVIVGNGGRYGYKLMRLAAGCAVSGFLLVVSTVPYWRAQINLSIGLLITLIIVPVYYDLHLRRLVDVQKLLADYSIKDALTNIFNRRYFDQQLQQSFDRARRFTDEHFALVMLDLDHFKQINDTYGHDVGDKVLVEAAQRLQNLVRRNDVFARYGGEEFVILLARTSLNEARPLAERLRQCISEKPFVYGEISIDVTVSLGLADYQAKDPVSHLVKRVDNALYRAKINGRDRVESAAA